MANFQIENMFTYDYSAGTYADYFQTVGDSGDEASTNIIDLGVAGIKIAGGKKSPWLIVRVGTAFATLTSLEILLETDSDSGFATNKKQILTWHFLAATMSVGAMLINQPLPNFDYQRYLRLYFNVVGSSASAGTLFAGISDGPEEAVTDIDNVNL